MRLLGLERAQWGVGEHGVVAVVGEQLALPVRDQLGVKPFDAAHDQPGADVVGFAPGGESGERDLSYFGVGDEPLFVFVPDCVRVVDWGPCRLRDAADRYQDSSTTERRGCGSLWAYRSAGDHAEEPSVSRTIALTRVKSG